MAKLSLPAFVPERLWQNINPWRFFEGASISVVNVQMGSTPRPEVEEAILEEVGTYGRQLGRIGDALEVLIRHVKVKNLTPEEQDAIAVLLGQLAAVRNVKRRTMRQPPSSP